MTKRQKIYCLIMSYPLSYNVLSMEIYRKLKSPYLPPGRPLCKTTNTDTHGYRHGYMHTDTGIQ